MKERSFISAIIKLSESWMYYVYLFVVLSIKALIKYENSSKNLT